VDCSLPTVVLSTHLKSHTASCKQVEHYRHPTVLHVMQSVCPQGHIATSRRVFASVDDEPAEDERGESTDH
jgi:hypothetical protein